MKTMFILLVGVVLGVMGSWWVQFGHRPWDPKWTDATASTRSGETGVLTDETKVKRDLYDLERKDIEEDLERSGEVIRRKARDFGTAIVDAASDSAITTSIKAQLVGHPQLSAWDISVSTTRGRVALSGQVDSPELIGEAILLAMETNGVRDVVSTLTVKGAPSRSVERDRYDPREQPSAPDRP